MSGFRAFLIGIAQVMMVAVVVIGTITGFFAGGYAQGPFAGFSFGLALIGAIVGFCFSGVSMAFLAIMLDIRQSLLSLQAKNLP